MDLQARWPGALVLLVLAAACTSGVARLDNEGDVSPEALLAGRDLQPGVSTFRVPSPEELLALSPEMESFVDAHVDRGAGSFVKLNQLLRAIISEGTFGLEYDDRTRTAAETFRARRGNCLSFSALFVAMARAAGLRVDFQEVDIPPDWSFRDDAYVLNRHVNVRIDLGVAGEHIVDFNIDDFRASYDRRTIDDARALAHYYNNIGVERMEAGDVAGALACFRTAIADNDPTFAPAWTNLGTLYGRERLLDHAEAAYLEALRADPEALVAMSNLASLYARRGDAEYSAAYRSRVAQHRNRNPYYRYHLAREAFFDRDFDGAIRHLKHAVRDRPGEDRFWFLLGLCHLQKGNEAAARRWISRAEEVAATEALKRSYAGKIDLLLRGDE